MSYLCRTNTEEHTSTDLEQTVLPAARECCAIAAAWQGMSAMQADGNARAAALSGLSPGKPCPQVHVQSSVICRTRKANLLSPLAFVRLWMESCG